jgi:hypothetical protein
VDARSILAGETENGEPALLFFSRRGLCRVTASGIPEYIGRPVEDVWTRGTAHEAFGVYHGAKRQAWFRLSGSPLLTPPASGEFWAVYHTTTGGWSLFNVGVSTTCAVMFSDLVNSGGSYIASTPELKPMFGGATFLYKYDDDTATADNASAFQAFITSRPYFPAGMGSRSLMHDAVLTAEFATGVTITATINRDFDRETKTATALLTSTGTETRVIRRLEDSGFGEIGAVQFTLGDAEAVSNNWVLDALSARVQPQEDIA